MTSIKDMVENSTITTQLLVINMTKGVTNQSKPYMTISFQDATGAVDGKKWDYSQEDLDIFVPGNVVEVACEVIEYKGAKQLKVLKGAPIPMDQVDSSLFVPAAPVAKDVLVEKLKGYVTSLKEGDVKTLVTYLLRKHYKDYIEWPAAVRNHHNYVSGLLYHSLCMADTADAICKLYPQLNRDIVIGVCLIHDLGKLVELSGPVATKFTLEGKLLGHISIEQAEVREAAHQLGLTGEIPVLVEHMILSHHSKPDFGSPVMPLTREALVVAMVDDLDAKMNILDKAYDVIQPGEFTSRLMTMDDRYFYKPLYTSEDNEK